ncbi:MAG: glycosyltransferase family 9 protein [Proteobacteria bacterium]|nr:glycosyltransferase family 9 protein [Pseudomonadota bacterium]MDA1354725.1 glycosyltransferase family 9 protein [Pseudomonadota bacterium]
MSSTGGEILVIKHGALGDFVLSTGPFAAIRAHHARAQITLLTTAPFEEMARRSGYFDRIWCDSRASKWNIPAWLGLCRRLRGAGFSRVYDLQTSRRSTSYYRYFAAPRPEWSGIARGCSHPHANPERNTMHTVARQREQLAVAGVDAVAAPDLSWLDGDISELAPAEPYVLLVPGGSAHRPEKRWPAEAYGELASGLAGTGYLPLLLGAAAERPVLAEIHTICQAARNLCGRTEFSQIVALARGAVAAVGNDTGPMHLITAAGCAATVLFSGASDPALTAPHGPAVHILQRQRLADLPVAEVRASLTLA